MPAVKLLSKLKEVRSLLMLPVFVFTVIFCGCSSGMRRYYADLEEKMGAGEYEAAAELVDKSKRKYGKKNVLLYYLDSGMANHFAKNYKDSIKSFEAAKDKFNEYYQKSVTAGALSIVFNDSAMPYYGEDFERAHINVFEALNFLEESEENSAVVEARQVNTLFRTFAAEAKHKNFYRDDGFIRYFMGLVYESGGFLNDAHVSYYLALNAYKNGIAEIAPPEDLINDAYTTALIMEMPERAQEIKSAYPSARKTFIPGGHGELIIINYNGIIPKKIDNVLEFALFDIWPYINQVEVNSDEQADFEKAKSIGISVFANDYIKVAFPKYERIPNRIKFFSVSSGEKKRERSYEAQDLATIAEKCLQDDIKKVYAKTLASAAVKYAVGKSVSKAVSDNTNNSGLGLLTQIGFNIYNSLTASADKRSWRTLPENILMARLYLPEGENEVTVNYFGAYGEKLFSETFTVNIESGKKTFKILRSAM